MQKLQPQDHTGQVEAEGWYREKSGQALGGAGRSWPESGMDDTREMNMVLG